MSVIVPVCLGLLGFGVSPSTPRQTGIIVIVAEVILFIYGLCLSLFFSSKYEHIRRLLVRLEAGEKVDLYGSVLSGRSKQFFYLDGVDRSLFIVGALVHLAFFSFFFWHWGSR
jgi:hypothetical protein